MSPELKTFMVQKRGAGVPWSHIAAMAGKPVSVFAPYIALERGYAASRARQEAEAAAAARNQEEAARRAKERPPVPDDLFIPPAIMPALTKTIADLYGLKAEDLIGPSREAGIAYAWHHLMWAMHQEPKLSLNKIGKFLGNRNHATVLHGVKKHAKRLAEEGL